MVNTFILWFNRIHPAIPAAIRFALYTLLRSRVSTWDYAHPENVGGWLGGVNAPGGLTLAFRDADGALKFRW